MNSTDDLPESSRIVDPLFAGIVYLDLTAVPSKSDAATEFDREERTIRYIIFVRDVLNLTLEYWQASCLTSTRLTT